MCVHASLSRAVPYIVLEQFDFACSLRSKRVRVSPDLEQKMSELCAWPLSTLYHCAHKFHHSFELQANSPFPSPLESKIEKSIGIF